MRNVSYAISVIKHATQSLAKTKTFVFTLLARRVVYSHCTANRLQAADTQDRLSRGKGNALVCYYFTSNAGWSILFSFSLPH